MVVKTTANEGWIKLWRALADNPLWLEKPFTKGQAWIDLLLLAQSQDNNAADRFGNITNYKRGSVYRSIVQLSNRWGWSRGRVQRFLENLKKAHMISYDTRAGYGTAITIENWGKYQDRRAGNGTGVDTGVDTNSGQVTIHKQEDKEVLRRKEADGPLSPDGEWSPPKKGTPEYERWRNQ